MIRMLEDYITSDALENEYNEEKSFFVATKIPLDDKDVILLFHNTSALGIKPEDISGCPLGSLGIPVWNRFLLSRWCKMQTHNHYLI